MVMSAEDQQWLGLLHRQYDLIESHLNQVKQDAYGAVQDIAGHISASLAYHDQMQALIARNLEEVTVLQDLVEQVQWLVTRADQGDHSGQWLSQADTVQQEVAAIDDLLQQANRKTMELYWQAREGGHALSSEVSLLKEMRHHARNESLMTQALMKNIQQRQQTLTDDSSEARPTDDQPQSLDQVAAQVAGMLQEVQQLAHRSEQEKERLTEVMAMVQFQDVQQQRIDRLLAYLNQQQAYLSEEEQAENPPGLADIEQQLEQMTAVFATDEATHGRQSKDGEPAGLEMF